MSKRQSDEHLINSSGGDTLGAGVTTTTGTRPKRTPEEQQLLDDLARLWGRPLTVQEENLAITQAEMIGDL